MGSTPGGDSFDIEICAHDLRGRVLNLWLFGGYRKAASDNLFFNGYRKAASDDLFFNGYEKAASDNSYSVVIGRQLPITGTDLDYREAAPDNTVFDGCREAWRTLRHGALCGMGYFAAWSTLRGMEYFARHGAICAAWSTLRGMEHFAPHGAL